MSDINQAHSWEFLERHFTPARLHSYLLEFNGDKQLAQALYEWNIEISGAFWELITYVEIALRNRINQRFENAAISKGGHWILEFEKLATPNSEMALKEIRQARFRISAGKKLVTPEQLVSELPFGFWVNLLSKRHRNFWPELASGFPGMPNRNPSVLYTKLSSLKDLRNRIGHHHRIWSLDLSSMHQDILKISAFLDKDLATWILRKSKVDELLARKPRNQT